MEKCYLFFEKIFKLQLLGMSILYLLNNLIKKCMLILQRTRYVIFFLNKTLSKIKIVTIGPHLEYFLFNLKWEYKLHG